MTDIYFFKCWRLESPRLELPIFWIQVKKQQLKLDMEQWTGSKLGKSASRLYIVTLLI